MEVRVKASRNRTPWMNLLGLATCPRCAKIEATRSLIAALLIACVVLALATGIWRPMAWVAGVYASLVAVTIAWHGMHSGGAR